MHERRGAAYTVTVTGDGFAVSLGMNFESSSDEDLLQHRAAFGGSEAFGIFYRRYERAVAAFHLRRVGQHELVPDLTAETFLSALAACASFSSQGEGSAARWLFGIAHNVLATGARRAASDAAKSNALATATRGMTVEQRDELALLELDSSVEAALLEMPASQRDAVRGYVLDGQSYDELAQQAGTSEVAMRKRVSRGLGMLRRQLQENR